MTRSIPPASRLVRRFLWILLAGLPLAPAWSQGSVIDRSMAQEIFTEAMDLRGDHLGALWGVPLDCPLIFADRTTRQLVASAGDQAGLLRAEGGVWVGPVPEGQGVANTAFDWADRRWTMVAWPLPARRAARLQLLGHELFHCIQPRLGQQPTSPMNAHLDTREGRVWLRMEWRALEEALIQAGDPRTSALSDALAFRAWRRQLIPTAAAEERALELHEGLAEYTGFRASSRPERVLADRVAVHLAQWEARPSFPRGFAYASGPAYGLLLDEAAADWRPEALRGADLGELAAAAYGIAATAPSASDVARRGARYELARVQREEEDRAARAEALLVSQERRFVEGPVLRLAPGSEFNFSFDPNTVQTFRGGMVLPTARISDAWGVLEVTANGVWLPQQEGLFTGIVLPAPSAVERPTEGDGWRLRLAPGWQVVPGERPGDWRVVPIAP